MTSLGFLGLSSQSVSGIFGPFWPENPETDWEDKAWASQACHPSPFQGFLALFGRKTPKWTGMMTSLGFPGLSSQSVSWFFGCFQLENLETSWDDQPGFPRLVIPVRFGFCLARFGQKARNGLG